MDGPLSVELDLPHHHDVNGDFIRTLGNKRHQKRSMTINGMTSYCCKSFVALCCCTFLTGILIMAFLLSWVYPNLPNSVKWATRIGFTTLLILHILHILYRIIKPLLPEKVNLKSHEMSLPAILGHFYQHIPSVEELQEIENREKEYAERLLGRLLGKGFLFQNVTTMLTGSTIERYNVPLPNSKSPLRKSINISHALVSDFDFMLTSTLNDVSFHEGSTFHVRRYGVDFVKVSYQNVDLKPSTALNDIWSEVSRYECQRFLTTCGCCCCCCCCCCDSGNNRRYISVAIQGPSIQLQAASGKDSSLDRINMDLTFSIVCREWPDFADWPGRTNRKWPDQDTVDHIRSNGIHLVPKSLDFDSTTWRISFSKAEIEISKQVPKTARLCLLGLKAIRKGYLSAQFSWLKSYHLKSILFRTLEDTGEDIWCEDKVNDCFDLLMKRIINAVDKKYCPHFWITDNNLFADLKEETRTKLTTELEKIRKRPQDFMETMEKSKFSICCFNSKGKKTKSRT